MEMTRADSELNEIRAERDRLKSQLDELSERELDELKEMFAQLATHNERLEQELSHCRQELAQRDKVMTEQENVLRVRDQLISALHSRDQQVRVAPRAGGRGWRPWLAPSPGALAVRLESSTYFRQEHGGALWPQDVVDGRRLIETNATLERKAVRCKAQEQYIKQLEKQVGSMQNVRISMEKRNAQLEHLVAEFSKQALLSGKHCVPR
ncbi:hypothetical protein FOCC_FOCC001828 [Frankliniella occidentalis]|nr:hypothetical protein FOCC_FOCC001828 [Frankliniella occidentalis]